MSRRKKSEGWTTEIRIWNPISGRSVPLEEAPPELVEAVRENVMKFIVEMTCPGWTYATKKERERLGIKNEKGIVLIPLDSSDSF